MGISDNSVVLSGPVLCRIPGAQLMWHKGGGYIVKHPVQRWAKIIYGMRGRLNVLHLSLIPTTAILISGFLTISFMDVPEL